MYPPQEPVHGQHSSPSAPPAPKPPILFSEPSFAPTRPSYAPTPLDEGQMTQQQPQLGVTPTLSNSPVEWSTGLCGWYTDMPNCCITCFCPCITFGEFSEIIDRGASSCPINGLIYAMLLAVFGCACMYSFFYRLRMRQQYNLKGSRCGDCCIHTWCEICALSQEYRELHLRGFDMHKGWHANVENQTDGFMTAPPMQMGMHR